MNKTNEPVEEQEFNIHELNRKLTVLADEIQAIDERLTIVNRALFGGQRISAIPTEPPRNEGPTSPETTEFNLYDAFNFGTTRAFYYLTYAREMISQLESFTFTSPKDRVLTPRVKTELVGAGGVSQQAGRTFRNAQG